MRAEGITLYGATLLRRFWEGVKLHVGRNR